jgi:hypothetical protein
MEGEEEVSGRKESKWSRRGSNVGKWKFDKGDDKKAGKETKLAALD